MTGTNSNVIVDAIARIFREYIIDANGMTSENSYKYASTKLQSLKFALDDVSVFASMISGKYFSDEANYWTSGIFVSAAINKIIKKDETIKLDFASLEHPADCVGFRLEHGTIILHGNSGDYLGERMSGGKIIVEGNAGYYVGYSMSRGSITVQGNSGGHLGRYMSGGVIKIEGQIGSIAKPCKGQIYQKGILQ